MAAQQPPQGFAGLRALFARIPLTGRISVIVLLAGLLSVLIFNRLAQQAITEAFVNRELANLEAISRAEAISVIRGFAIEAVRLREAARTPAIQEALLASIAQGGPASPQDVIFRISPQAQAELERVRALCGENTLSLALVDTNGVVIAIDPMPVREPLRNARTWDWFTDADFELGRTYVESFPNGDDGLTDFTGVQIATTVFASDLPGAANIGVMYAVLAPQSLRFSPPLSEGLGIGLYRPDGTLIAGQGIAVDDDLTTEELSTIVRAERVTSRALDEPNLYGAIGMSTVGLSQEPGGRLSWVMVVSLPTSTFQSQIGVVLNSLRGLAFVFFTLLVAVATVMVRATLRPLYGMLNSAEGLVRTGRYDEAAGQAARDNESLRLANALSRLARQIETQAAQITAAAELSREMALTGSTSQALERAAQTVYSRFRYAAVRIYLIDDDAEEARIRAAYGLEADYLLASEHSIPLGDQSLVGRTITLREPQIERGQPGGEARPVEMALPLLVGADVLGVLMVVASADQNVDLQNLGVLTLVADQIGSAAENAKLLAESAGRLAQIEALNRRLTREAWEEYLGSDESLRHTLDPQERWPRAMTSVTRRHTYTDPEGRSVLAVPLIIRGETVGTIAAARPAGEHWSSDEIVLVEALAQRVSIVADGLRLLEESNRRAEREERVNEISSQLLQRAASVDGVLQRALNQLNTMLGSDQVSLRLGAPPVGVGRQIVNARPPGDNGTEAEPELEEGTDDEQQ